MIVVTEPMSWEDFYNNMCGGFSEPGMNALWDYFAKQEEEIIFDIAEITRTWSEFADWDDMISGITGADKYSRKGLEELTTILEFDDGVLIRSWADE